MIKFKLLFFVITVVVLFNFPGSSDAAKKSSAASSIWSKVSAQEKLKALRVAQLEAYRALVERVQGFVLDSGSTVYECMLDSDRVKARVDAVLKGATELDPPSYSKNGMVMVTYGVNFTQIAEIIRQNGNSAMQQPATVREHKIIEAVGCGALPGSPALDMLRAKRAAELDAYRMMAERFVGLQINGSTTIADMALNNDRIEASIAAYLRGLKPVKIHYSTDGICQVTMQLKVHETVKVIDRIINTYNSGRTEKIEKADLSSSDKIFTVIGYGAQGSKTEKTPDKDFHHARKSIVRKLIKKNIIVE